MQVGRVGGGGNEGDENKNSQPGVTAENEKLILLEILNVCTRGLVL